VTDDEAREIIVAHRAVELHNKWDAYSASPMRLSGTILRSMGVMDAVRDDACPAGSASDLDGLGS
jgi:hypothetical protein